MTRIQAPYLAMALLLLGGCGTESPGVASDAGTADAPAPIDAASARPTPNCAASELSAEPDDPVGAFTLVPGEMYVVYSELRQMDDPSFVETSNVFLVRGEEDDSGVDVWVFGTGYGDGAALVDFPPPRPQQYASRSGDADAADADAVIRDCLAVEPARARLHLIAPHYHFDHMNYEFVAGLLARGHSVERLTLYVDDLDYDATFCGEPCRGTPSGGGSIPPFPDSVQARAVRLGAADDPCGTSLLTFETPALGSWTLRLDSGHTSGTVSAENTELGVRLRGAGPGCLEPDGLVELSPHKSIAMAWGEVER